MNNFPRSGIRAGIKAAGYVTPTPIQQQAIPVVLQGRDILLAAQTGTGKTAFMLPILQRLTKGRCAKVRDAHRRAGASWPNRSPDQRHAGQRMKVKTVTVYGGVGKTPPDRGDPPRRRIVVACPGRLLDLIGEGHIDLSTVEVLVLDRPTTYCDMGFLPDIRRILKHVPAKRQTLFFSATMPDDIRAGRRYSHQPATRADRHSRAGRDGLLHRSTRCRRAQVRSCSPCSSRRKHARGTGLYAPSAAPARWPRRSTSTVTASPLQGNMAQGAPSGGDQRLAPAVRHPSSPRISPAMRGISVASVSQ